MLLPFGYTIAGNCVSNRKQRLKFCVSGLANVGGIFVVLVTGLTLAVISSIVEFVYNARKNSTHDKVSCRLLSHG